MDRRKTSRHIVRLAAAAAFIAPFFLAIRGSDWQRGLHPDEITIRETMQMMSRGESIANTSDSLYPQGFFVLADIYWELGRITEWLLRQPIQEWAPFRDIDAIRAPIRKRDNPPLTIGRHLNAVLAGLCGLFMFLAVREATGSAAGGLCATALAACSPFIVEHAHYCETDLPFAAGLALSLWPMLAAIRRRSFAWMAAAAAAAAAAFACKYTVAPLVPFCILIHVALCLDRLHAPLTPDEHRAALLKCLLATAACLVAAIAAYALLTPTFRQDQSLFWGKIFRIYGNTHHETMSRDLSAANDPVPFLRVHFVLRGLLAQFRQLGAIHVSLASAATVLLLVRRRSNPCGPWMVALTAMFILFDITCAPWIRSQEFIPVAVLFGALTALAAGELHAMARSARLAAVRATVPALCVASCVALAYGDAARAMKMFSTEDCRNTARHWIAMAANPNSRFAAGRFAGQTLRDIQFTTPALPGEAERIWNPSGPAATNSPSIDYYIRQDVFPGRGFTSAVTGKRHPRHEAGWTNFLAHATLLREWRLTPGYQTSFAQMPIGLWGIVPEGASFAVPSPLAPRATAYRMGPEHYDAAQGGDWLGPIEAIRTVGARKGVRFVPPRDGHPLYAVTRHAEGVAPARIKWEGCFWPRETTISPGRADWFIYKPSLFDGWGDVYVRTRVRMRGDDQTSLCLTTVTADPAYAAELLARGGSPDKAAEVLAAAGLPTDLAVAVRQAVKPIPSVFYKDFARIRFGNISVTPNQDTVLDDGSITQAPVTARLECEFPVLFDPGRYRVSFRIPDSGDGIPDVKSIFFTKTAGQRIVSSSGFAHGENVEMDLEFDKPTCPHIGGVTVSLPGKTPVVTLEDFEISWDPIKETLSW